MITEEITINSIQLVFMFIGLIYLRRITIAIVGKLQEKKEQTFQEKK